MADDLRFQAKVSVEILQGLELMPQVLIEIIDDEDYKRFVTRHYLHQDGLFLVERRKHSNPCFVQLLSS